MTNSLRTMLVGGLCALTASAGAGTIQINELRLDQPGTDTDEYLELLGPPDASLDGLSLVIIGDGTTGSGTVEEVIDLTGLSMNASGLFLMAEATFALGDVPPDLTTDLNFENSDNVTYLLVEGFTGMDGDDLDTDDDGVLDAEPWTAVVDAVGLLETIPPEGDWVYGATLGFEDVGPDGAFVPGQVYRCSPNGLWLIGSFDPNADDAADTPGEVNLPCPMVELSVVKTGPTVAVSGSEITYTLTLANSGVDPAADVSIVDILPDGVTFLGQVVPDGVDIVDDTPPDLEWSSAAIAPKSSLAIQVMVRVDDQASGALVNTVDVATSSMGDDPADNSSSLTTVVSPLVEAPAGLAINEIRIDQTGADNDEYFELRGEGSTDLAGLAYVVIGDGTDEQGSGVVDAAIGLTGSLVGADGLFLAAEDTFSLIPQFLVDLFTTLDFENGDNVTHLLVANFTGGPGDDLDLNDDGTLDVTPWSAVLDAVGLIEEPNPPANTVYAYGASLGFEDVGPDGTFVPGHVFRCTPDGIWRIGLFDPADPDASDTPATENPECPPVMLSVTKTGPAEVVVGANATYLLTITNAGLAPAEDVVITDTLPDGLIFVSETSPANVTLEDVVEPDIVWAVASVGPKESFVIELVAQVVDGVGEEIVNTVEVTTTSVEDDPADNADTALTTVVGIVDPPENLVLSEIRVDQLGGDNDEYAELRGDPDTSLNGVTYIVLGDGAGGSGVVEAAVSLTNAVIPASGFLVIAEATFTLGTADVVADLNFENGDNVTHLLVANFSGAVDQDLDTNDDGVLDVTPWSDVIDAVGLVLERNPPLDTEYTYGVSLGFEDIGPDGIFVPSHVYRCQPTDAWTIGTFDPLDVESGDTPNAPNPECPAADTCPEDTNGDRVVDVDDLIGVILDWGTDGSTNNADVNDDGTVNVDDLVAVILAWGRLSLIEAAGEESHPTETRPGAPQAPGRSAFVDRRCCGRTIRRAARRPPLRRAGQALLCGHSMGLLYNAIAQLGLTISLFVSEFGRFAAFGGSTAYWILMRPRRWLRPRLLIPQLYAVGVASIPVVGITGAFIGMVLALEGYDQFRSFGQEGRLGGVINISVVKQIGPVLAAVMVAGRVGGALAAELGTMRVTEQLDAMRAMGADPIPQLVVPRFLACVLMTPLLTVYSDLLGVWGGWLITVKFYGVAPFEYWDYTKMFVDWWEPTSGLIKAVFFGGSIGMIACYKGFECEAGAAGVGQAATEAFVSSFIAIIVINLVLAQLLNTIYTIFISPGSIPGG